MKKFLFAAVGATALLGLGTIAVNNVQAADDYAAFITADIQIPEVTEVPQDILLAQASSQTMIINLSSMSYFIQSKYDAVVLSLELSMQGIMPVYSATVVINNEPFYIIFNAVTGEEIARESTELQASESFLLSSFNQVSIGAILGGGTATEPQVQPPLPPTQPIQPQVQPVRLVEETSSHASNVQHQTSPSTGRIGEIRYFPEGTMSRQQAETIALNYVGGGVVRDFDIYRRSNGRIVFEIEIRRDGDRRDHEIYLDAMTGEIIKYEID